jgi:hypothetical protein
VCARYFDRPSECQGIIGDRALSSIFAPAIKAISMVEKKSGNGRCVAGVCVVEVEVGCEVCGGGGGGV